MTPAVWRALAHRHPGRVVYPSFNPDRPREPWVPVKENRTWWERNKPRHAEFRTVRTGWDTDPVPAAPPSGMKFNPNPGRDAQVPNGLTEAQEAYHRHLLSLLPIPERRRDYWT